MNNLSNFIDPLFHNIFSDVFSFLSNFGVSKSACGYRVFEESFINTSSTVFQHFLDVVNVAGYPEICMKFPQSYPQPYSLINLKQASIFSLNLESLSLRFCIFSQA